MANWNFGQVVIGDPLEVGNQVDPSEPLRVLVCGAFSGTSGGGGALRPIEIDRDNFDSVMARIAPKVELTVADSGKFIYMLGAAEDLHPDALVRKLMLFAPLRDLRQRLSSSNDFAAASRELLALCGDIPREPIAVAAAPADGLLDALVADHQSTDGLRAVLRRLGNEYALPTNARQAELIAYVDELTGAAMREVLTNPAWQAMESVWGSLRRLVMEVETGAEVKICLLDLSRQDLSAALGTGADLASSAWFKLLVADPIENDRAWALVLGCYRFADGDEDVADLARIAAVAARAKAPFIAAADDCLAGCTSLLATPDPDEWRAGEVSAAYVALRAQPSSRWLGLTIPRFLLRLPYGKKTEAIESFPFEELPETPAHTAYTWGAAPMLVGELLLQAFAREGWHLVGSVAHDVSGFPVHYYREDGETVAKPCAEIPMTERALERLLEAGLIPLASVRDSDVILLPRLQSIASPPTGLAGRWY